MPTPREPTTVSRALLAWVSPGFEEERGQQPPVGGLVSGQGLAHRLGPLGFAILHLS